MQHAEIAPRARLAWGCAWGAVLAVAGWMAKLSMPWLAGATVGALGWSWHALRSRDRWAMAAVPALWLAIGLGAGVQFRLAEVARSWPRVERQVEERAAAELNRELDRLVGRGEEAVEGVESAARGTEASRVYPELFTRLATLQRDHGVSSVALFDPSGAAQAWAGEHRGAVPEAVRRGERSYVFHEGPLFSYIYFVRPLPGGRTAAAAVLLEADLTVGEGEIPFAERFHGLHGLTPRFSLPDRARGRTVWDWSTDRPILSVSFAALTQQHWWERVVTRGRRAVGGLWLGAVLLLCVGWYRRRTGAAGVPVAVATLGLLLVPLGGMVGAEELFSPLQFVLPVPGDVTLGMLLVLLTGATVWLLTRRRGGAGRLPVWVRAGALAAVYPGVMWTVERSSASGLLAGSAGGGFPLQLATVLLLGLPTYLLLRGDRRTPRGRTLPRMGVLGAGLLLAALLGVAVVMLWHPATGLPVWTPALWAIPFAAVASALPRLPRRSPALRAWLIAGWLAGTAGLAHLWNLHLGAELRNAERELATLGTEADPYLDFLLRQFAERAAAYAREGEEGVNLLYHSWVASGLAREGYEARLAIYHQEQVETELRLSELGADPRVIADLVSIAGDYGEPTVQRFTRMQSLHYLLVVPLADGRSIAVAVPPRQHIGRVTALARFLHPETEADAAADNESLYLVPISDAPADSALRHGPRRVEWSRVESGWRSEARAHFPSGWMHAHLYVRTTAAGMLLGRGVLVLVGLLGVQLILWSLARLLCGELPVLPVVRRRWVRSFRGRLTLALFLFFLLPTAVFGVVAYGAVAREVVRSAAGLARRALDQAVPALPRASLARVGAQVRADLLLYHQGILAAAAAPEVLDLGLFHTWLPPQVYLTLASGEDLEELEERRLSQHQYLVAYRRLDPGAVLAVPIPLESDEITRRQREFAHVALLMSLLGAALSVVLSYLAGRALTRPLDQLSHAVATVGSGNLGVRLPAGRQDEFGRVYGAFNQMVRRLQRARTALVRETRRTETIVAEAATGVLALDADGCVELVNPRASQILGEEPAAGESLPRRGAVLTAVADAVDDFWRSGSAETGMELEIEGRIIRLRLRRLAGAQEALGAVVALEDVTAEVRTARVLAWGEMARQVAHEIKNPLTPIKLSVQHLRRAFTDGRSDFAQILERNVEAILTEIDRLGEIARAFARFGAPQQGVEPLERVDVAGAVRETLALYRGGGGGIGYRVEVGTGEPLFATARLGELKEVLVNLLENAREALDGAGEVRVSAAPSFDGEWVEVVVEDTGEGISSELLPRIFEPHFSTRSSGTGLGLAIVRRMVESWGGEVTAESEPGAGTRVRIRLRSASVAV